MTSPSFDDIVSTLGPERLADCIVLAIEDHFGHEAVSREADGIPNEYCLVHIVYQTTGFLCGDGLPGLLHLDNSGAYPKRLAQLGFTELATDIERYLRERTSMAGREVDAIEQLLYRHSDAIYASVVAFISTHQPIFQQLLPELRRTQPYLEVFDQEGLLARRKELDQEHQRMLEMIEQLRAINREHAD